MASGSGSARVPVTVIVPAKNEGANLQDCLASLEWAEEVFVVDSRSTDATAAIVQQWGRQLAQFDYHGGWPKKKNWAIRNLPIASEWILVVDADERVTTELAAEIAHAITDQRVSAYYVRWKFVFLGRWMKHSWSHGWMLRLFRRGCGEYEDLGMRGEGGWDNEVHENIVVTGEVGRLKEMLVHDTNEDLAYWIRKQNEFSTWNACRRVRQLEMPLPSVVGMFSREPLVRRKVLKALFIRMPFRPLFLFLWLYVIKLGFLDGRTGYVFCRLRAIHEFNVGAKVFELRNQ